MSHIPSGPPSGASLQAPAATAASGVHQLLRPEFAEPAQSLIVWHGDAHAATYAARMALQRFASQYPRSQADPRRRRSSDRFSYGRARLQRGRPGAPGAAGWLEDEAPSDDFVAALAGMEEEQSQDAPQPGHAPLQHLLDALARQCESAHQHGASPQYQHELLDTALRRFVQLASQGLRSGVLTLVLLDAQLHWLRWLYRRYARRRWGLAAIARLLCEALGEDGHGGQQQAQDEAQESGDGTAGMQTWHALLPLRCLGLHRPPGAEETA